MPSEVKIPHPQKWTAERVMMNLMEIMKSAKDPNVLYLGQALERQGLYSQIWSYWRKVFFKNDDILEAMLQIDTIFESKLYVGALRKELSPWVAIFSLKHNHKWCDRPEVELPPPPERQPMLVELDEHRVIMIP